MVGSRCEIDARFEHQNAVKQTVHRAGKIQKTAQTRMVEAFFTGRGRRLRTCFASPLAVPETAFAPVGAPFRPLRQPRLAVSATGGASATLPHTRFWSGCETMQAL